MPSGRSAASLRALRIAIVHSFYNSRQPSGENRVVEQHVRALQRAGHEVLLVSQRTDDRERRPTYPVEAAVTVATGFGPSPLPELHRFRPDVVHVHNLFPNFGRAWISRWPGPVVAFMHNFRPLCPSGTLFRDGHTCTDCLDLKSSRPALHHSCYRGSRRATLPLALSTKFGADPVLRRADRVVTMNPTMAFIYERAGVPSAKIRLVPNFAGDQPPRGPGGGPWLFVGRLTPEKGIRELVAEWPNGHALTIVGDGPLRDEIAGRAGPNVTLAGEQSRETVAEMMRGSTGLVFPSRCYEGAPMVYPEALAAGTPVLAWAPSSVADLATVEETGLVVTDLPRDLERASTTFPTLRQHCRSTFDSRYTEAAWIDTITRVNEEVT